MRNEHQVRAFGSKARFTFLLCGRRGGKTFLIKHKICKTVRNSPAGSNILYMAPTNAQAKALMWNELEDLFIEYEWDYKANIQGQYYTLTGNRRIFILGAEKYSRIRGLSFAHVFLDEFAFYTKKFVDLWRAVRATLSDQKGGATLCSTPNGKSTDAYDVYLAAKESKEWEVFQWNTVDNPYIDPDEVEAAKSELDEKSFRQEYEAAWISNEGLAYYSFDEKIHIVEQPEIQWNRPLFLCWDFNVSPTTLLLAQKCGDMLRVYRQYAFLNSSTEATIDAFIEDYADKRRHLDLRIRGDASGSNRSSNTGKSDYYYMEERLKHHGFQYTKEVPRANPPIVDRVKHVNAHLKPMVGKHKIEIDPTCKGLIKDLSAQELNGRHPCDKANLGHAADALGYCVWWEHKKANKKKTRQIQL